ncbi:tannase/feruloyl esterase family alpha/beta hydrolase [Streptomyces sp. JJ36]|uniref:tannase/feruloyl esterase family alpha/beta hydrolase n=1 Tax=Streptomyces sp. JJ36 TaxID=2736645 RepID=UPI001F2C1C0B|nr:tannase/feruloyl esterase family alpha/beta hydrolase [Streptomyces sp. JJ36]MCF6521518.1 tannase/feruloyl esterase family alpha/beta hydrolase [Streptomyces sp. JJ36]
MLARLFRHRPAARRRPGPPPAAARSAAGSGLVLLAAGLLLVPAAAAQPPPAGGDGRGGGTGGPCARVDRLTVPGAAHQQADCLPELTTAGTVASGHTVPADWAGLTAADAPAPSGVPGIQIDGYFPDTSRTNGHHGWDHDAQFVIRLPDRWNGGLVVSGAPGVRAQYANDRALGDHVLSRGYAFASTDKGNTGAAFFRDGRRPGDAVAEWNRRVTQLTRAARAVVTQRYLRPPERTLAAGLSNGGYLVRWQLENRPWLYDGGIDWEGTLWRSAARRGGHGGGHATGPGPNLFTFLPPALRAYPVYAAGGAGADEAHAALRETGFPAGSEFLWPFHYDHYWDVTQRIYREEFDPGFDGEREAGTPFCAPGTPACDTDYAYAERPREVHRAVDRIGLTGRIGRPLISFHGTLDVLLPISESSDVYAEMVREAGRGDLHRYHRVEGGTHVDGLVDVFPGRLRPLEPCFRSALAALEQRLSGQAGGRDGAGGAAARCPIGAPRAAGPH